MNINDLKELLWEKIDINANTWIVFTGFKNDKLIFEKWIIFSEKPLDENISKLYDKTVLWANIDTLLIDIISSIEKIKSKDELNSLDLSSYGIFIGEKKSDNGVFMLPNTQNIANVKTFIQWAKKKQI